MTVQGAIPPKMILLATDLTGRGDRALDRTTQLATEWGAEVLVVHALEASRQVDERRGTPSWRSPADIATLVERQVREDVRGPCPILRFHIEEGAAAQVVLDAVEREGPDLVVAALDPQPLGDSLGKTIDELFRRSPVSTLVVKRRPNGPYSNILVGTDFTTEARRGLEMVAGLFPEAVFALMHAYEPPYRSLHLGSEPIAGPGETEAETIRAFLEDAALSEDQRRHIVTLVEHGPPEVMLAAYVLEKGADLTVIGAYERGKLFHMLVGGSGPRIVQAAPSDVLMVRAER